MGYERDNGGHLAYINSAFKTAIENRPVSLFKLIFHSDSGIPRPIQSI
jgi:hypothetical protein